MKTLVRLLVFSASACAVSAESGAPAPADLLVVPELAQRPANPPERAPAQPTEPGQAPEKKPAMPEGDEVSPPGQVPEAPADGIVTPAFPLSRYEDLWKKSPFQLESTAPLAESAGLAQRYALTGIAEISGEPIAFVVERATQQRLMVRKGGADGSGGLELVQIDVAGKKYGDSTVTLRQGAEVGVVKFDAGPPMPAPNMASPMAQPGSPVPQPPGLPAMPPSPQIPGRPGPTATVPGQFAPGVVPAVPGPGVPQNGQLQQPAQQQVPPPRVIRRRAIVPAAP